MPLNLIIQQKLTYNLITVSCCFNPLTIVPAVTSRNKPWPLFPFWRHHLLPNWHHLCPAYRVHTRPLPYVMDTQKCHRKGFGKSWKIKSSKALTLNQYPKKYQLWLGDIHVLVLIWLMSICLYSYSINSICCCLSW